MDQLCQKIGLYTQKHHIGLRYGSAVVADLSSDEFLQLFCLFRMPVHKVQFIIRNLSGGFCESGTHISGAKKCKLHIDTSFR